MTGGKGASLISFQRVHVVDDVYGPGWAINFVSAFAIVWPRR